MENKLSNIQAEKAALGSIIIDDKQINIAMSILGVNNNVFYDTKNRAIYKAMVELSQNSEKVDLITVQNKAITDINIDYLTALVATVESPVNCADYCKIIKEKFIMRELLSNFSEISEIIKSNKLSVKELLTISDDRLQKLVLYHAGDSDYVSVEDLAKSAIDLIGQSQRKSLNFGFRKLDEYTYGMYPGELVVLAGRPSTGKSTFALNIAKTASKQLMEIPRINRPVIYVFSFEMTNEELYRRILSMETGIALNRLRWDQLDKTLIKSDIDKINTAVDRIKDYPIYFDTSIINSVNDIRIRTKKMQADKGIAMVIIDYLQLIPSRTKRIDQRQQEVAEISRNLKLIAKDLDAPVIALSQLNRAIEKRRGGQAKPMLSDLRDSGAIEADADLVLFLHPLEFNASQLIIGKQRNGMLGTINMVFKKEVASFFEESGMVEEF